MLIGTAETVSVWPPVFEMVNGCDVFVPAAIVPKSRLVGVTAICAADGLTPDPLRLTVVGEFVALLGNESVVETVPVDDGAKLTATVALPPAAIESGNVTPVTVNPQQTLGADIDALEVPVFDSVRFSVELVPVIMLPKLNEVGEALTEAVDWLNLELNDTVADAFALEAAWDVAVTLTEVLVVEAGAV